MEVVTVGKVIDLFGYKMAGEQSYECWMLEIGDAANELCEDVWHLLVPMRRLGIKELTIDATGSILNIKYRDDSNDEANPH